MEFEKNCYRYFSGAGARFSEEKILSLGVIFDVCGSLRILLFKIMKYGEVPPKFSLL